MLGWSPIPEKPGFGCPLHRPLRLTSRLLNAGVRTYLASQRCKGDPAQLSVPFEGDCPKGWRRWSF